MEMLADLVKSIWKHTDIYQVEELDRINSRMMRQGSEHQAQGYDIFELQKKVELLENYNAQIALLFRTLYETCLEKELFSKEEFKKVYKKIDLIDGIEDGKITPKK